MQLPNLPKNQSTETCYSKEHLHRGHVNGFKSILHLYFQRMRHMRCMVCLHFMHVDASFRMTPKHIAHSSPKSTLRCTRGFFLHGKHILKRVTGLNIHDASWVTPHRTNEPLVRFRWLQSVNLQHDDQQSDGAMLRGRAHEASEKVTVARSSRAEIYLGWTSLRDHPIPINHIYGHTCV